MIIGLTGKNGAGKGTVAELLMDRGFSYRSLSDILREKLLEDNREICRETLISTGNSLREAHGPAVLAIMTAEKINTSDDWVIDSIRNPAEIKALKEKIPGFTMIEVSAAVEVRFQRCLKRGREGAELNLEDFIAIEKRELESDDPNSQQLLKCIKLCDYSISNDSDLESLENNLTKVMQSIN